MSFPAIWYSDVGVVGGVGGRAVGEIGGRTIGWAVGGVGGGVGCDLG